MSHFCDDEGQEIKEGVSELRIDIRDLEFKCRATFGRESTTHLHTQVLILSNRLQKDDELLLVPANDSGSDRK